MHALDENLFRWLRTSFHYPLVEKIVYRFSRTGTYGLLWTGIALIMLLISKPQSRKAWAMGIIAGPLADGVNHFVKVAVGRARPLPVEGYPILGKIPRSKSLPSGHGAASFCAAQVFSKADSSKKGGWYFLAIMMGLSRPYLGVHYPSDIMAGAVVGHLFGRLLNKVLGIIDQEEIEISPN